MKAKNVRIDHNSIFFISSNAKKNCQEYFEIVKLLAQNNYYAKAYANLVFCIEEGAKSRICMLYDAWIIEQQAAKKGNRNPQGPSIELKTVQRMFSSHEDKHIATLTQSILALINTFDDNVEKRIIKSIQMEDPAKYPEIMDILKVFKNLQRKRETAMLVHADGTGPQNITKKDYDELYPYAENLVKSVNIMLTLTALPYEELERKVKLLLQKVDL